MFGRAKGTIESSSMRSIPSFCQRASPLINRNQLKHSTQGIHVLTSRSSRVRPDPALCRYGGWGKRLIKPRHHSYFLFFFFLFYFSESPQALSEGPHALELPVAMLNPQLLKKIKEDPGGLVGSLECLDLSSSRIGAADMVLLAKAFNAHPTYCGGVCSPIVNVNLRNNDLCSISNGGEESSQPPDYKGFQMFCKSMQNSRYIRVLNFSENILGPPGFKAIFELLDANSSLHELM